MTYNEIIQKPGKKVKKHVYYIKNGVTTYVNDENIERIKFDMQTPLVGTSINGCEITLKEPINGNIYVQVDATYGSETKSETFGPFTLKEEPSYDANKKTYLHKCYDNMLKSMVDYQAITINYPCTVLQFFTQLVSELGYTNNISSLPNGSRTIASDIYTDIEFTYRDVLDDIAYANGVLFYIDGNEIKIAQLGGDTITIDDDILKNKNIEFGEHYGPINSIVLSRSSETDNVYLRDEPSIIQNGLCEFKIIDNQLMNSNDRSDYLPAILNRLKVIEYDIYDTELTGYGKLRPLQAVNFNTNNNNYSSYIFNNEITLTTGYKQAIYNDRPEQTETEYKYADTTDKRQKTANIIVNKQLGEISLEVADKMDESDFTKANIILKINDNTSQAQINAGVVNLSATDVLNLLAGNTINLTTKNIVIDSTNFGVDIYGNLRSNSGKIANFNINNDGFSQSYYPKYNYTQSDLTRVYDIIMGHIQPTQQDIEKYDLSGDGSIGPTDYVRINNLLKYGINTSTPLNIKIKNGISVTDSSIVFSVGSGASETTYTTISLGTVTTPKVDAGNIDSGIVSITPVADTPTRKHVDFNKTFTSVPIVVATAESAVIGTTVRGVSVANITTTGFDVYIYRTNTTSTNINWIAMN